MARTRDRVIAIVLAVAFFVTSFGLSFVVIWQFYKDNKEAKAVNQQTGNSTQSNKPLKGTQMAGFTPVSSVSELQKIDQQVGTGKEAKAGDTVTVDYTGAVAATGTIFESSLDTGQPANFPLSGVIKGWQEGIPGMKEGGKRRLIIPADLAYGASGNGTIPPNAALVFDVTLISVGQ